MAYQDKTPAHIRLDERNSRVRFPCALPCVRVAPC